MSKETMLGKKVWAVIGANENTEKFGNKVYKRLKGRGYEVYPVNPKYNTIDGEVCYENLSALPKVPEVINMVVSPKIGRVFIEEAIKLGINNIWFQPGTFDKEIFEIIKNSGIKAVQGCVLVSVQ